MLAQIRSYSGLVTVWACQLVACGGAQPSPYFGDASFLRFGVDPRVEAEAVEAQTKRAGFDVVARAEGTHHVALGLSAPGAERTAVRVVTSRGTVLSLDSDADPAQSRAYALITAEQLRGVDALPADQVFVRVAGERASEACIAGFRVNADGTLARIVIDAGAVIVDGCASEIQDINGDGVLELVVQAAYTGFDLDDPPLLRVPLSAHGGGYRLVSGVGAMIALLNEQRAMARQELSAARHALDVERALRTAIELAAIARFDGASMGAQLKTLDEALRGLVLTGREAALVEQARQFVRQGWSEQREMTPAEGPSTDRDATTLPSTEEAPPSTSAP